MKELNFIEKTAFNYNQSFQDKKKIAELTKEIEKLKAEIEQLKTETKQLNDDDGESFKVIATVEDFSGLICQYLKTDDIIKLIALLNQSIKKQQPPVKNDVDSDKTGYIAKRIFKSRPAKKAALINSIKTMFQEEIADSEIESIILDLQKRNFIKIVNDKITYL